MTYLHLETKYSDNLEVIVTLSEQKQLLNLFNSQLTEISSETILIIN